MALGEPVDCSNCPRIQQHTYQPISFAGNQPHCCPVCNGKGKVPCGFYSTGPSSTSSAVDEKCHSCQGTGVLWQPQKIKDLSYEIEFEEEIHYKSLI